MDMPISLFCVREINTLLRFLNFFPPDGACIKAYHCKLPVYNPSWYNIFIYRIVYVLYAKHKINI